ncbi:hypothetical protein BGX28_009133, partial [Mortierella sp. GBA30]
RADDRQSNDDDSDIDLPRHSSKQRGGFPLSVFGHHSSKDIATTNSKNSNINIREKKERNPYGSESEEDFSESEDSDYNNQNPERRRGRRRRRLSASASHLLAQAPPVPDLRFDHNYRKALDQIYETHAQETAHAAALSSLSTFSPSSASSSSEAMSSEKQTIIVPSIAARITVMTLRDIIIMPFIHGFFWGFGAILLSLAGQRTLGYHIQRTWRRFFGNPDDTPMVIRGEPARERTVGHGGFGGLGLRSAGSGFGSQSSFGRSSVY